MFNLRLPGYNNSTAFYDKDNQLKFDPPVYEQRYAITIRFLEHEFWQGKIKKIVDFGCAEMKLLQLLKRVEGVEHILEVDIDKKLLEQYAPRAKPLLCDYVKHRETPLKIEILKGSISTPDICLKNTDAVVCIEIIEHLYPDVLENVPYNIFGYIKPKIAIFTTPNVEFNILFQLEQSNGFRHWDHKFEWTRSQFKNWCLNICQRFPNYFVSIHGVSQGPPEKKKLGSVSQMAVFIRKDVLDDQFKLTEDDNEQGVNEYELIYDVDYPYIPDERTHTEKILDEVKFQINRCKRIDRYINYDKEIYEIPLQDILNFLIPLVKSVSELNMFLVSNHYEIVNDKLIMKVEDDDIYDDIYDDIDECLKYRDEFDGDDEIGIRENDGEMNLSDISIENWD